MATCAAAGRQHERQLAADAPASGDQHDLPRRCWAIVRSAPESPFQMPFPEDVGHAGAVIDRAGQHEQEIAQPIQVDDDRAGDGFARLVRKLDGQALGAPADRPCQVELGGRERTSGQDELGQRLELGLERVDRRFEMLDVLVGDGVVERAVGRGRQAPSRRRTARPEAGDQTIGRRVQARAPAPRPARR